MGLRRLARNGDLIVNSGGIRAQGESRMKRYDALLECKYLLQLRFGD